jgi:hypothetical protein
MSVASGTPKTTCAAEDDLNLRHFLWARRRDTSLVRQLVLENVSHASSGVEHTRQSACACVDLRSQHEAEWEKTITSSLSQRDATKFFEKPVPTPPKPFAFENRKEAFPIRASVQVVTCDDCKGTGWTCGERGCSKHARHGRCEGTGQLATWRVVGFTYFTWHRKELVFPVPSVPRRVRWAYGRWLTQHPGEVATFSPPDVRARLAHPTEEAHEVARSADGVEQRLRSESSNQPGRELFVKVGRYLTPLAYGVSRIDGRGHRFFLVGDAETEYVSPTPVFDTAKVLAWAATLFVLFIGQASLSLIGAADTWAPGPVAALYDATGYAGVLLLQLALAGATIPGFKRMRISLDPVAAVLVLPASGARSQFLTLVSFLGSFCGELDVADTNAEAQHGALFGEAEDASAAESLTVRHKHLGTVRFIEMPRHDELPDDVFATLLRAVDCVVCIGAPTTTSRSAARPTRLAEASIPCVAVPDAVAVEGGQRSFEEIRTQFADGVMSDDEVAQCLHSLLGPLSAVLRPVAGEPI